MKKHLIIAIVDRAKGEEVIQAAETMGSKGGTLIHGRGHENYLKGSSLFDFQFEPERVVVLIVADDNLVLGITRTIYEKLELQTVGNGVVFTLPVHAVKGLSELETEYD